MNWLRSRAERLTLLALFALALQFGLSFGHFHQDRAFAGKTTISDQASAPSPDTGRDTDGRQDICAICATVAPTGALSVTVIVVTFASPSESNTEAMLAWRVRNFR